jgi:hypothetical protein
VKNQKTCLVEFICKQKVERTFISMTTLIEALADKIGTPADQVATVLVLLLNVPAGRFLTRFATRPARQQAQGRLLSAARSFQYRAHPKIMDFLLIPGAGSVPGSP